MAKKDDAGYPIDDTLRDFLATETGIPAYNFNNLSPNFEDVMGWKRTIEFRGYKATLDIEEARLWVKFCLAVVDYDGQ